MKRWITLGCVAFAAVASADLVDELQAGKDLEIDIKGMNYTYSGFLSGSGTVLDADAPPSAVNKDPGTLNIVMDTAALGAGFSLLVPWTGTKQTSSRVRWATNVTPNANVVVTVNGQQYNMTIKRIQGQITNDLAATDPLYSAVCNEGYNALLADTGNNTDSWVDVTAWVNNFSLFQIVLRFRDLDNVGLGGVPRGTLYPDGFTVQLGQQILGNLAALRLSDNARLGILSDENESEALLEVSSTSADPLPGSLAIRWETIAVRDDLNIFLRARNYATNAWDDLDFTISTLADQSRQVTLPGSLASYIESGTRRIQAHVNWIPASDLDSGDGWSQSVDELVWISAP